MGLLVWWWEGLVWGFGVDMRWWMAKKIYSMNRNLRSEDAASKKCNNLECWSKDLDGLYLRVTKTCTIAVDLDLNFGPLSTSAPEYMANFRCTHSSNCSPCPKLFLENWMDQNLDYRNSIWGKRKGFKPTSYQSTSSIKRPSQRLCRSCVDAWIASLQSCLDQI